MRIASRLWTVVLIFVLVNPCFALWEIATVSKDEAKKMGIEVRAVATGANQFRVELEFKLEEELKKFSRVDLRLGVGDTPVLTAALKEDRSKPGRVECSFYTGTAQLDQVNLWVMVPGNRGGTIYHIRVKDFVDLKKGQ